MQTPMKNFYALAAALLLTTILAAPITVGEGSGITPFRAVVGPVALA